MTAPLQDKIVKAIWRGDFRAVQALLDAGATVDGACSTGFTPLMQAAEMENIDIARLLLDRGADVNFRVCSEGKVCPQIERRLAQILVSIRDSVAGFGSREIVVESMAGVFRGI